LNLWQAGRIAGLATATRKASVSLAEREGDEVVTDSARLKVPLAVGSPPRARACSVLPRKQGSSGIIVIAITHGTVERAIYRDAFLNL